jgi:hypothetical protein
MFSKNIYMPYFYIIRHRETCKQYAGSRWAKGCHPDEFMQSNGYTTSSLTIKRIIKSEGLDSFEILDIITLDEMNIPFGTDSVYAYETWFLVANNCATSDDWYNTHNNDGGIFGSEIFRQKAKESCREKYGVEYYLFADDFREKSKDTCREKYGVDYPAQNKDILEKMKSTNLEKYGVEFPLQSIESLDKFKSTNLEKYGVEYSILSEEVQQKSKKTKMEKYGVDHHSKDPIILKKIMDSFKSTNLEKYGVEFPVNIQVTCPHCNKSGNRPIMLRWHFDKCKLKG